MRTVQRMAATPIRPALGLAAAVSIVASIVASLAGCAAPAARLAPRAVPQIGQMHAGAAVGVIAALRPVPGAALGADPAAFRAAWAATAAPVPAGPSPDYVEVVIRAADGRTWAVVQPRTAGLAPGDVVRLMPQARLIVLAPDSG